MTNVLHFTNHETSLIFTYLIPSFLSRASTTRPLGQGRGRNWCWQNCERRQRSAENLDNIVFKLLKSFPHQGTNYDWKRDVFCPCAIRLMLRDSFLWHNLVTLKLWALYLGFRQPMGAQDAVLPADRFNNYSITTDALKPANQYRLKHTEEEDQRKIWVI